MAGSDKKTGFHYFVETFLNKYNIDKEILVHAAREVWEKELTEHDKSQWELMSAKPEDERHPPDEPGEPAKTEEAPKPAKPEAKAQPEPEKKPAAAKPEAKPAPEKAPATQGKPAAGQKAAPAKPAEQPKVEAKAAPAPEESQPLDLVGGDVDAAFASTTPKTQAKAPAKDQAKTPPKPQQKAQAKPAPVADEVIQAQPAPPEKPAKKKAQPTRNINPEEVKSAWEAVQKAAKKAWESMRDTDRDFWDQLENYSEEELGVQPPDFLGSSTRRRGNDDVVSLPEDVVEAVELVDVVEPAPAEGDQGWVIEEISKPKGSAGKDSAPLLTEAVKQPPQAAPPAKTPPPTDERARKTAKDNMAKAVDVLIEQAMDLTMVNMEKGLTADASALLGCIEHFQVEPEKIPDLKNLLDQVRAVCAGDEKIALKTCIKGVPAPPNLAKELRTLSFEIVKKALECRLAALSNCLRQVKKKK